MPIETINLTINKTTVGLSNVDNTSDDNKPVSSAQATAIGIVQDDIDTHESRTDNPHIVTKAQVGLANVDNTSDVNKPVSSAQQTALNAKQNSLGFTPENVSNKATDFSTLNDTLYPSVSATNSRINSLVASAIATAGASYLTKDGNTGLTGNWNAGLFSITANSVIIGALANRIAFSALAGANGTLTSSTHGTKNKIFLGAAQTSWYDELNDRFTIGATTSDSKFAVKNPTGTGITVGSFDQPNAVIGYSSVYNCLELLNSNGTANNWVVIGFTDVSAGNNYAGIYGRCINHSSKYGDLGFLTNSAGGYKMKMYIASDGKVGIGSDFLTPAYTLDVQGDLNVVGSAAYRIGGTSGVSGSFTTTDLKTVTVTKGIITAIV